MKRRISFLAMTVLMVLALSSGALMVTSPASANGATQISGIGFFDDVGECTDHESPLALIMTGDLEGCLYIFPDPGAGSPSGTYREWGSEIFVGTYMTSYRGVPFAGLNKLMHWTFL